MSKPNESLKQYWSSLNELEQKNRRLAVFGQKKPSQGEFPPGSEELAVKPGASRRKFMGILGASTALAGLTSGCIRKPKENIMPYAKRPEDLIPGKPMHYASVAQVGATVMGLIVETVDGRPIKIEGNPRHSGSGGKTDAWAQADVLSLYDPDRSKVPVSTFSAAHATAHDLETAKDAASHTLCETLKERVLDKTKSLDQAEHAAEACAEAIKKRGRWKVDRGTEGEVTAAISYYGEERGEVDWNTTWQVMDEIFEDINENKGKGVALVVRHSMSPTFWGLIGQLMANNPELKLYLDDPTAPVNTIAAAEMLGGEGARMYHSLETAEVILAVDSDFLGTEQDHVRLSAEYAKRRKIDSPTDPMNRLYSVEPHMTVTGAQADHRLKIKSTEIADFLQLLVIKLMDDHGLKAPTGSEGLVQALGAATLSPDAEKFATALAADLIGSGLDGPDGAKDTPNKRAGRAAVIVGERQPPAVHGIGALINAMLRSQGQAAVVGTVRLRSGDPLPKHGSLEGLARSLEKGDVDTLICLETNPVYDAPGSLKFGELISKAGRIIHVGLYEDETGKLATWHLPGAHALAAWGDLEAVNGVTAIAQPMIAPLYDGVSAIEFLGRMVEPNKDRSGMMLVRGHWNTVIQGGVSDRRWNSWLHEGLVSGIPRNPRKPKWEWDKFNGELTKLPSSSEGVEVNFHLDYKVLDGTYVNNGWMQELPHPISKLTWDNAAHISAAMAEELVVKDGDMLDIKLGDRAISVPCWVVPGQAENTVSVTLGYGREGIGIVAEGSGFDVYPLRDHDAPHFGIGKVSRGAGKYDLVCTQTYGSLDPDGEEGNIINYDERPIYRETTRKGFKKNPDFAQEGDLMPDSRLESLWDRPELKDIHQWGMSIDLNSCTGCLACVVACNAENNIPVVGKDLVANGREMHWMRIDRYFRGDIDNPQVVLQPVMCQHCEAAPCETVCPVAATVHSPDGMNDMAYNRCIGTRYCANNCPYKVRRFNYFNFNAELTAVEQMQKNPDVTVRFRGVMEKCSYCTQRVQQARITQHVAGENEIPDGMVVSACEQVCPTSAIVFGNVADPSSRVSRAKRQRRDYSLLADLNTTPRTSYLGRVRNPNPKLEEKA